MTNSRGNKREDVQPQTLQVEAQILTATTDKAMKELAAGKGKRFANANELFKDLGI
jgi:DNA-damage-inducible protein J